MGGKQPIIVMWVNNWGRSQFLPKKNPVTDICSAFVAVLRSVAYQNSANMQPDLTRPARAP